MKLTSAARTVYVSLTAVARAVYTIIHCPMCGRWMLNLPGEKTVETRRIDGQDYASGRGLVLSCKRCRAFCEVVEHAGA